MCVCVCSLLRALLVIYFVRVRFVYYVFYLLITIIVIEIDAMFECVRDECYVYIFVFHALLDPKPQRTYFEWKIVCIDVCVYICMMVFFLFTMVLVVVFSI